MKLIQISASAGSGKTYTLTRHFLDLLRRAAPLPKASGCALHGNTSGYSLAEILAATFTNKAAAEMKTRVVNGLKEEALKELAAGEPEAKPGSGTARQWVERILRHYGSLNIRTIDSLLDSLVRLSALELALPPDFELSFDPEEYFTPLYDALMDELTADPDVFAVLPPAGGPDRSLSGPGGTKSVPGVSATPPADNSTPPSPPICQVQGSRTQASVRQGPGGCGQSPHLYPGGFDKTAPPAFASPDTDAAALRVRLDEACHSLLYMGDAKGFTTRGRLQAMLRELVDRLLREEPTPLMDSRAIHARLNALHAEAREACEALLARLEQEELQAAKHFLRYIGNCAASAPYRPLPDSVYRDKRELDECLNKGSRGAASAEAEAAFAGAMAAVAAYGAALPLFRHALLLAPLSALAHEIHSRMRGDASGKRLPALCLPNLAGKVLSGESGVSDALCRMGSRLSRLLLDEFQDTSREQWAAILPLAVESLSTGGSLTYVGDVKQAIYGWRGGDAGLFDEALSDPELRAIAPRAERRELEYNWRSHPAVVTHNNAFFSLLSPGGVAEEVLAAMLPAHTPGAYRARAVHEAERNYAQAVQAIPPEKQWDEDPKSASAGVRLYSVEGPTVAAVHDLVRQRLRSLLRDELLPVWRFGDIAILVRSGDEAALVAGWLGEWGLPVVTENSFLLASHPLVERLIAFLEFLEYPLDDLAFWEFVSASECLGPFRPAGLTDWLARTVRATGRQRPPLYRLFRRDFPDVWTRCIEPFHTGAGLMSAYDTLMEAVRHFSIPERMPGQLPFVRRLMELAHLAESRGHSSLAAFLAFWRGCKDDEKLPLPENMDAVRVMTIHKAKGLEFPVVILPFQHKGKRRDPDLAAVRLHGIPILTRAGRELPDIYYPACITDELERLNLLYVAWTRPVYALHAFITRPASAGATTPLTRALEVLVGAYARESGGSLCQWETVRAGVEGDSGFVEVIGIQMWAPPTPAKGSALGTRQDLPALDPVNEELQRAAGSGNDDDGATHLMTAACEVLTPPHSPGPGTASPWRVRAEPGSELDGFDKIKFPGGQTNAPSLRPMDWLPRLKIFRSPLPAPGFTPRQRGILVHLCLEHLILSEISSSGRERDVARAVRQGMRLFPLPLDDPDRIAREMTESLGWFASLPEAPLWLSRGLREQSIMDDAGRMHRVDLLVDKGDGAMHAVDYKTGQARNEHHAQVRRYMRLASAATGRPLRGFLVYLDERRLLEVPAEKEQA